MLKRFAQAGACTLVLAAVPVIAEAGVFVGGGIGKSSSSEDIEDGSSKKVYVGYELDNAPVFFDLSYQDTGDTKITNTNASVQVETMQIGAGWQIVAPSGSGVFVKAAYYSADSTVTGPFPDQKDDNTGLSYGLGGIWMFIPKFGVRVEWERIPGVEHFLLEDQDISLITASAIFKLGK